MSFFTRSHFQEKYTSVDDIYRYNLKTYFFPQQRKFLRHFVNDEIFNKIVKGWRNCTEIRSCLKYVTVDQDSTLCLSKLSKEFIINNNLVDDIYCLKKDQIPYEVNFLMRKGFPIHEKFNDIVSKIITAGFIQKWTNDVEKYKNMHRTTKHTFITLKTLWPILLFHCIFNTIAVLIFAIEYCYGCRNQRNNNSIEDENRKIKCHSFDNKIEFCF
ncbi:unnamed protein product [Psylliodes chrysocephalus]|uniref:Uncharacterized protein n=1 Tax=Psylliodes chrysocephalus TaxID=3402493 RepID=A0A9P0D9B2_9CUCU|nr:unnamed protein product [Psylliodes chrysocephala]